MKRPAPLFLARRGYRLRRMMDAARVLPALGAFLFLMPLLWGGGTTGGGILFVFGIWAGLIAVAAVLAGPLAGAPDPEIPQGEGEGARAPEPGEGPEGGGGVV